MTKLKHFSVKRRAANLVGMRVAAGNAVIGAVTKVMRNNNNQIEGVVIRRDRDQTFLAVHNNRIDGVDEERGLVIIN